jgi:cytochrome P450
MDATDLLARVGRSGALPAWLAPWIERFTGFAQVLTTPSTVTALLSRPEVTVPYGERAGALGLGGFPLALDGDAHVAARALVAGALAEAAEAHRAGVEDAATAAAGLVVAATGGRLETVGGLVDPVLRTWVERWFGLPGHGEHLLRSGRAITHAMFLNPVLPARPIDRAALERIAGWLDLRRRELAADIPAAPLGTLAAAVLARCGDDPAIAADQVLGLTVGPLALGSWALANAVDDLLDRPWVLDSVAGPDDARAAFSGAVARRPPLAGLPRRNPTRWRPPGATVVVPTGTVLAATSCALRGTAGDAALAFGRGAHACLGVDEIHDVAAVALGALARRHPRRAPAPGGRLASGPAPSGVTPWPFPGRLEVRLLT